MANVGRKPEKYQGASDFVLQHFRSFAEDREDLCRWLGITIEDYKRIYAGPELDRLIAEKREQERAQHQQ